MRALSLVFSALCAAFAGVIYIAFYRSFIPTAGQFRELDGIASVIIGGGSIFGGYGTIIGSLAGAAVITLLRALLSLQIMRCRRDFLRHAAALGQRLHRPHPDRSPCSATSGCASRTSSAIIGKSLRRGRTAEGAAHA